MEPPSLVCLNEQVIVLSQFMGVDPPGARHAQVEHHRVAAVGVDQAIFGTARKRRDERARQTLA